jgi:hypothetical protein
MKKLPIGIYTFRDIIEDNYIYVDKTKEAYELINNYRYVFLSRPRRFGKSLFLDTLNEIFNGSKDLFKDLYIYDKHDFEPYPVIRISWAGDFKTLDSTKEMALTIMEKNQRALDISCKHDKNPSACFSELIEKAYYKYGKKVVVLIDEYDKPILDNIEKENLDVAKQNREFLRGFYTIIKDSDKYIRFAFLTGVSRFSRVSIFSGLNNLVDISLNPKYAEICGFTHDNLENEFKEYLESVDLEEVRKWYNGYNFLGKRKLYNPFDILQFIDNGYQFDNYWFQTGTPSFLVKLLKERNYNVLEFENLKVGERILNSFDIDDLEVETIMFQSGYLTIKDYKRLLQDTIFTLSFPNLEVKKSFNDYLLDYLVKNIHKKTEIKIELIELLIEGKLEKLKDVLTSLYASVPYNYFTYNKMYEYESFYAVVLYMYLSGAGIDAKVEDLTNQGRIDLIAVVLDKVYIFELKLNGEAIEQIEEKRYYEKYINYPEVYIIGLEFDKEKKNVKNVEWKRIK